VAHQPVRSYGFGPFSLDPHERVLLRDGRPVPLPPTDLEMLLVLVENHGHVVEKGTLMKRLWPATFVEEANLSHHVFTLRRALRDDTGENGYIETVPRRGYRFAAPVVEVPDPAADPLVSGDERGAEPPLEAPAAGFARDPGVRPARRKALVAAAVVIVALAAGYGGWALKPAARRPITRLVIALAEGDTFATGPSAPLALSPDGTRLVYTANDRLYLRALDRLDPMPAGGIESPGLASARGPFFSPDGQWIGFWELRQLKKMSVTGGAPVTLCDFAHPPWGVSWGADGTILMGHGPRGIWRVSASGGAAERIIAVDEGQRAFGPQLLPDGRSVLFTLSHSPSWDEADIVVQSLDSGRRRTLVAGGADGRYLPTGHLVYALRGSLLAVPFDPSSLEIRGRPVPVVEPVGRPRGAFGSAADVAVSTEGTLAYVEANASPPPRRTLVWVDRQGREETIPAEARPYVSPRLAPDGTRVALDIHDENRDIWMWDLSRRTMTRVTSDPTADLEPAWTPNGRRLVFASGRGGLGLNLFWQPGDGTGVAERLTDGARIRGADTISPDGKGLVVRESDGHGTVDLTFLDLGTGRPAQPASTGTRSLVRSPHADLNAEISPDGRWLAYQSNGSGAFEVYVRPFPSTEAGQWRVSREGGTEPLWARDGRELYYRSPTGALMRVAATRSDAWTTEAPTQLFEGSPYVLAGKGDFSQLARRTYDVSPDGRRFLMIKNPGGRPTASAAPRIVVVQNWFEELTSKVVRE
jgi:eukaryotic-like serine/threonine-protein kinase